MDNIKVLLVEDHEMTRLGISLVCENTEGLELVAEAENGKKGVDLALKLQPDVILMDIGLPEIDGIQAAEMIKKQAPNIKILMFTSRDSENDIFDSLSAGADGYIMKGTEKNQMVAAIKAVAEGAAWLDPSIARLVLSSVNRKSIQTTDKDKQTVSKNTKNIFIFQDTPRTVFRGM